jgi:hypothetical protein
VKNVFDGQLSEARHKISVTTLHKEVLLAWTKKCLKQNTGEAQAKAARRVIGREAAAEAPGLIS